MWSKRGMTTNGLYLYFALLRTTELAAILLEVVPLMPLVLVGCRKVSYTHLVKSTISSRQLLSVNSF